MRRFVRDRFARGSTRTISPRRLAAVALGVAVVCGLAVPFHAALDGAASTPTTVTAPTPAEALRGDALTGETVDLRDLRGHVVLVNVWASWCAPCRDELPLLLSTVARHEDAGLRLFGINSNDRRDRALALLDEVQGSNRMVNLYDPEGRHAVAWGARGVPETFVVDRDGRVVARQIGEVTPRWLEDVVLPLVER